LKDGRKIGTKYKIDSATGELYTTEATPTKILGALGEMQDVKLSTNVFKKNVDDSANITQAANYKFVTDSEKTGASYGASNLNADGLKPGRQIGTKYKLDENTGELYNLEATPVKILDDVGNFTKNVTGQINGVAASIVQEGAARANLGFDADGFVVKDIKGVKIQDDAGNVYLDPEAITEAMKLYGKKILFCGGIYFGTEVGSMGNIHQYNNDLHLEAWDPVYSIVIDTKLNINDQRVYGLPAPSAVNDAIRCDTDLRAPDATALQGYSPQGIRDMNTVLKCTSIVWSASIVAGAPTPDYYMEFSEPTGTYKYRVPCYRFTIPA